MEAPQASQSWKEGCADRMNMFINMDQFSDVCIKFGDEQSYLTLNCHYVILALNSDLLRTKIESLPLVEGRRYLSFTEFDQSEQTVIADIILSFYNGDLAIDEQNFSTIYTFSTTYQIHWILKQARLDVHRILKERNVYHVLKVAEVAKCKLLRDEVLYFIRTTRLTDYSTIIPAGILPSLSPTLLKTLVKATKDLDRSELDVLEMARVWMGKSPVRLAYIKKLFKHISWQRLATSEAEVERLSERLSEELMPLLNEAGQPFLKQCLQDASNYAACRGTMESAHAVFMTGRWGALPCELAQFVLSSDYINVRTEYVVAEAAMRWLDCQNSKKLTADHVEDILRTIRMDRLHGTYVLTNLRPHALHHGVTVREWHEISAAQHQPRKYTDSTLGTSIVKITKPPKLTNNNFISLKDGDYTLTSPCTCSYSSETGPKDCMSITVNINTKQSPPIIVKRSQCQYCTRSVLHVFCELSSARDYPSLNCGTVSTMKDLLKSPNIRLCAVLTESLDPARFIRSSQWRQEGLEIVLRSLDNNNLRTVSEYEALEAAFDWLDARLPDKVYHKAVLSCIRFDQLHAKYVREVVTKYVQGGYFINAEEWKRILRTDNNKKQRRTAPLKPYYAQIVQCEVPNAVAELYEGSHTVTRECVCDVTTRGGNIGAGKLTVTITLRVKEIPALRVEASCDRCCVSLKHAYITANCRWKYFPGLSTATFYKLRQMFRESMMSSSDTSDEDSSPAISTPGSSKPVYGSWRRDSSRASNKLLYLNLILGP